MIKLTLLFLLVVVLLTLIPIGFIWSINTLFGLTIAYSCKTWLAAFVLWAIFPRGIAKGSSE